MKDSFYGSIRQTELESELHRHVEEILIQGFTILENALPEASLPDWRRRIDDVYAKQEAAHGRTMLQALQELDVARAPLLHDAAFIEMAANPPILKIVQAFLGEWFILNLQNAVINRPHTVHHQSAWHRDLPHQNFVISRPIAINALYAIDDFSAASGGTRLVPFTHKLEILPSDAYIDRHAVVVEAPAGSAVVFDAMLFHRAGANTGSFTRRAVNHLYTIPLMKQQYDFPSALAGRMPEDAGLARLLGFTSVVPVDDSAWRSARATKMGVA